MLLGVDELSHTQQRNSNDYCQDNEISWIHWELDDEKKQFLEFVKCVLQIRREQPVLQRRKFFHGRSIRGSDVKDITWFDPSGNEMADEAWNAPTAQGLGMRLAGDIIDEVDEHGEKIVGQTLLFLLNAADGPIHFALPAHREDQQWERKVDTADVQAPCSKHVGGTQYEVQGRS